MVARTSPSAGGLAARTLGVVLALVLALVVLGWLLPSVVEVERAREVRASPESIHARLADLGTWTDWLPWSPASDPGLAIALDETPAGAIEGAHWSGGNLPSGSLLVTASPPGRGVWYDAELEDGRWSVRGALHFEPTGETGLTRVLWSQRVTVGPDPLARIAGLTLDARLGPAIERGLARLAELCERP